MERLQQWEFRVCGVFLVDSQFMVESYKVSVQLSSRPRRSVSNRLLRLQFISGVMAALSSMVSLEIPQVNIMTKMDLLSSRAKKEIEK